MRKLYDRLIKDAYRSFTDDNLRIQIQFRWTLKILLVVILTMSIINLRTGHCSMALNLILLAFAYYINYWIVYKGKDRGVVITIIIMNIIALAISHRILVVGTNDGFSIIWVTILPATATLLTGRKYGTITTVLTLCMLVFYFWTPLGLSLLKYNYSPTFRARFPFILLAQLAIIYFYETLRIYTLQAFREERTKTEQIYERQYSQLTSKIQDARRVRHDMRHHFVMINSYLEDGKLEEAKDYIRNYYTALPFEEALSYCEHYGINALLTYFVQRAKNQDIPCDIHVNYPANLPIPDEDLTIIFGNLLENALDASQDGITTDSEFKPNITVRGMFDGNMLMFSIENNSIREAVTDKKNHYISTKHPGNGIGIDSVKAIVEKHDGELTITQEHGTFAVKGYLM